jgi:hypothetical protein
VRNIEVLFPPWELLSTRDRPVPEEEVGTSDDQLDFLDRLDLAVVYL